ncbi:hypothetical protein ABHN11_00020 [Brevibacillus centrosporus]|uniref:hypothetical protein n=1 Tax=Brevibacillus centrosporus TaxID=54910 RepID=UPI003D1E526D
MTINEWAGIIALPIAVVNLAITIYKEFIRKPKLQIELILSEWIASGQGIIDFQLNVRIKAIHGDVHIRSVRLLNKKHQLHSLALVSAPHFTSVFSIEKQKGCYYPLAYANEYVKEDLTKTSRFMESLGELKDKGIREVEELKITKDSVEILTFAGRIIGTLSSEWMTRRSIPDDAWFLQIAYDRKKSKMIRLP